MKVRQASRIQLVSADWGAFQLAAYAVIDALPSSEEDLLRLLPLSDFFHSSQAYVGEQTSYRQPGWEKHTTYGRHLINSITELPTKKFTYEDFLRTLQELIAELGDLHGRNGGAKGAMNVPVEGEIVGIVRQFLPARTKIIQTFIDPEEKYVPLGTGITHDYFRSFIGIHESLKFIYRIDLGVD